MPVIIKGKEYSDRTTYRLTDKLMEPLHPLTGEPSLGYFCTQFDVRHAFNIASTNKGGSVPVYCLMNCGDVFRYEEPVSLTPKGGLSIGYIRFNPRETQKLAKWANWAGVKSAARGSREC